MPKNHLVLSVAFILLIITACNKSNSAGGNNGPNPLVGTWTFVSLSSNATVTASETIGPITTKVIDVADFTTINNMGTVTFTADSMASNGLGYSIDTTYTSYTYIGSTGDTTISPLTTTIAPTTATVVYKVVGQDSVSFPGGTVFSVGLNTGQTAQINGAHFTINGNTLKLSSTIDQTGNETVNGITLPATTQAQSTILLTRQ
jgi:hypothetical protein